MARYWEVETPKEIAVGKNLVKVFKEAGKVQMFVKVEDTPRGLSKGVTLDLQSMSAEEIRELKTGLNEVMDAWLEAKELVKR